MRVRVQLGSPNRRKTTLAQPARPIPSTLRSTTRRAGTPPVARHAAVWVIGVSSAFHRIRLLLALPDSRTE